MKDILKTGNYASKQIFSKNFFLSFSHQRRFKLAKKIATKYMNKESGNVLDYGCGDGTFLHEICTFFQSKTGCDISPLQILENTKRFQSEDSIDFIEIAHLNTLDKKFNFLSCQEVLEHCTDEDIKIIIETLIQFSSKDSTILLSVPIESGLTIIIKQFIRVIWGTITKNHYQYTERYTWKNLFKMVFASKDTIVPRNFHNVNINDEKHITCGHYAFNWKKLKYIIEQQLDIKETYYSPINFLGPLVNSQVFMICTLKKKS